MLLNALALKDGTRGAHYFLAYLRIYVYTLLPSAVKFDIVIHVGEGVFYGSDTPQRFQFWGTLHRPIIITFDLQRPNLAW